MAEFPSLPLWTDAYLGDTTHLTTIEHGAYLLLLITAWRAKTCDLPDDDKMLARYTRMTIAQWHRIRPTIIGFFHCENGRLSNRRLKDERDAVRRNVEQKVGAGKASALKRFNRNATAVEIPFNGNPTITPTPTITPIKSSLRSLSPERSDDESRKQKAGEDSEFEEWYAAYPKHKGRGLAKRAYLTARKKASSEQLLAGAQSARRESVGKLPRFVSHPAAWLNAEGWLDEPDIPVQSEIDVDFFRGVAEELKSGQH